MLDIVNQFGHSVTTCTTATGPCVVEDVDTSVYFVKTTFADDTIGATLTASW